MKSIQLGDTECKEDNGVKYFKPKFDSFPQSILVNHLEKCREDNNAHATANEGETTDEPNIHESKN